MPIMNEPAKTNAGEISGVSPSYRINGVQSGNSDTTHLDDSLAMTPWERILANDDMVNFGDSLHASMEKRRQQT